MQPLAERILTTHSRSPPRPAGVPPLLLGPEAGGPPHETPVARGGRGARAEAARIHICWGNGEMPRTTDVELKDIIDIILKAKPAGMMLMASNGRHAHEWMVFRDTMLPEGKYVIPGVLDSTTNIVEHPEVVADRLIRYAGVVGRENGMAGTDCGFGAVGRMVVVVTTVTWGKFQSQ